MFKKAKMTNYDKLFYEKQSPQISGQTGELGEVKLRKTAFGLSLREVKGDFPFSFFKEVIEIENELSKTMEATKVETENAVLFVSPFCDQFNIRAYKKNFFNSYVEEAKRGVRLIDKDGKENVVPDGALVSLIGDDINKAVQVRYIDSTHFEMGLAIWHILQCEEWTRSRNVLVERFG